MFWKISNDIYVIMFGCMFGKTSIDIYVIIVLSVLLICVMHGALCLIVFNVCRVMFGHRLL